MNQFLLKARAIPADEQLVIGGIELTNAIIIGLSIDNISIEKLNYLDLALIVFSELIRSLSGNGCYLIFTSASGVADDGGWEGVNVNYEDDCVIWDFEVEDTRYHFEFDTLEYEREIRALEAELTGLTENLELEPAEVFFPESWD